MQPTLVDLLLALIVEGPIGVAVSCRLAATLTKDLSAQIAHSCGHLSSAMLTVLCLQLQGLSGHGRGRHQCGLPG